MTVKVAINGYGTIGKRAASAVSVQDDMEIIGVTKTRPSYEAFLARDNGHPLHTDAERMAAFKEAGLEVAGSSDELFAAADIVIDCTPGGVGEQYRPVYEKAGVKAIFQGGEDHGLAGISYNSTANHQESWGAQFSRVVSCNTTGLLRTLHPLDAAFGIEEAFSVLVRRGTDPGDSKKGPINAIEPALKLPTHHGPDVQSIMPWLNIETMAVKVPSTIMHLHANTVDLKEEVSTEKVLEAWSEAPRIKFVKGADGIKSTAQVMEMARDLGRSRGDLFEIAVWEDGVKVVGNKLFYYQGVHQESDVVPEIVDCVRSMCKVEKDAARSVAKTNAAMGIPR